MYYHDPYETFTDVEEVATVADVTLLLSEDCVTFLRKDAETTYNINWGNHKHNANGIRRMASFYDDSDSIAATRFMFDATWKAANTWLANNTKDLALGEISFEYTYIETKDGIVDEMNGVPIQEVCRATYEYIDEHENVQDKLIEARRERVDEPDTVERIDMDEWVGTYVFEDLLYTHEDFEEYKEYAAEMEERGYDIDPQQVRDEKFDEVQERDAAVVVPNGRKKSPRVYYIASVHDMLKEKPRAFEAAMQIATGHIRDDYILEYDADYDSGDLLIEIKSGSTGGESATNG